ncbi:hypothetical protein Trydic_g2640 [Trypoxylus dichotomus]
MANGNKLPLHCLLVLYMIPRMRLWIKRVTGTSSLRPKRVPSRMKRFVILVGLVCTAFAYYPSGKEHLLTGGLFREIVNRMGKNFMESSYLDFPDGRMGSRSLSKDLEEEELFPIDYDVMEESNLHPSLRDQEFLEHSSLWGGQLISGGTGEGHQKLKPQGTLTNKPEIKTDTTLPAYCNPPNPCPVGYTGKKVS